MRIISKTVLNEVINLTATDPDYKTVISFNIEDTYLSKICKNIVDICSSSKRSIKFIPTLYAFNKAYQKVVNQKQIMSPDQYQTALMNPTDISTIENLNMFPLNYFTTSKLDSIQIEISDLLDKGFADKIKGVDITYYLCIYLRDLIRVLSDDNIFKGLISQKYKGNSSVAVSVPHLQTMNNKLVVFHNRLAIKYSLPSKVLS